MSLELLGLGLNFLGGAMGEMSASRNRRLQFRQMQQAQKQFDAQMDQSIQRRVKDAKSAGVHPLFALGASVGSSPTISSSSSEPQGSPAQAALSSMAAQLGIIEGNRAAAKRDEAQAALFDSERKRIEMGLNYKTQDNEALTVFGNPRKLDAVGRPIIPQGNDPSALSIVRPAEDTAQKAPGVRAGETPMWVDVRGADGKTTRTLNPELEWDELIHPGVITFGWNRFWRGMRQNLEYARYKLLQAGLSDQQIAREFARIKRRAKQEFNKRAGKQGPSNYGYNVAP